jgi:hypothetical protein
MEIDAFGETFANCTIAAIDINLFSKSVWPRDEGTVSSATRPLFYERRFPELELAACPRARKQRQANSLQPSTQHLHKLDDLCPRIVGRTETPLSLLTQVDIQTAPVLCTESVGGRWGMTCNPGMLRKTLDVDRL